MTILRTTDIELLTSDSLVATVRLTVERWNSQESGLTAHTSTEVTYWRTAEDAIAWRKTFCSDADVVSTCLEAIEE